MVKTQIKIPNFFRIVFLLFWASVIPFVLAKQTYAAPSSCGVPGQYLGNGMCCSSFLPGTKIAIDENKTIEIEKLKIGDYILSYDESSLLTRKNKLVFIREGYRDYYFIVRAGNSSVRASANHPFYIGGSYKSWDSNVPVGYKRTDELLVGEKVYILNKDGRSLHQESVSEIKKVNTPTTVYSLTVERDKNYFAQNFAVHNKQPWPCCNIGACCSPGWINVSFPGPSHSGCPNYNGDGCYTTSLKNCPAPTPTPTPTPTPAPPPPPAPSCTISLSPNPLSVANGGTGTMTAVTTASNGTISQVEFSSSATSIATVTTPDASSPYTTTVSGVGAGSATVTGSVRMNDGAIHCSNTATVNVAPPGPWWQTKDADIATNGDIISAIPSTCSLPGCNPAFDLDGSGGFPGIPIYGGTSADFRLGAGTGVVSSKSWIANTSYMGKTYGYNYFAAQGPKVDCATDPTSLCYNLITTPTINGGDLNSGGTTHRGYVWYKRVGDLTITGNVNQVGSRKVVLLVEGGDLKINGLVNLQQPGVGYFMAIVGKDATGGKGNIIVDPSVTHPNQPGLQGMFLADGQFRTGLGDKWLWLKGAVTAYDGVVLQRDLGAGNPTAPAEYFEYDPTLIFTYPRELTKHGIIWKEVAP